MPSGLSWIAAEILFFAFDACLCVPCVLVCQCGLSLGQFLSACDVFRELGMRRLWFLLTVINQS